jgi:hypothetical protein
MMRKRGLVHAYTLLAISASPIAHAALPSGSLATTVYVATQLLPVELAARKKSGLALTRTTGVWTFSLVVNDKDTVSPGTAMAGLALLELMWSATIEGGVVSLGGLVLAEANAGNRNESAINVVITSLVYPFICPYHITLVQKQNPDHEGRGFAKRRAFTTCSRQRP